MTEINYCEHCGESCDSIDQDKKIWFCCDCRNTKDLCDKCYTRAVVSDPEIEEAYFRDLQGLSEK